MKKILLVLVASLSFINAQTHIVPDGFSGFTVSFKHDQNVDFFGEGKFLRNSYSNAIGFGYIYNSILGIDFGYGYSLNDKKDIYTFTTEEGAPTFEDNNFNFVENFRAENPDVGDKTFSFGLTYYLNESQSIFSSNLPLNLSFGVRYGTNNYTSDALNFLDQDFYGKFYTFEFGAYKEIETNASFYMIPRFKLSSRSEKNIYNSPNAVVDGTTGVIETESFKVQSTYFEIALPFILNNTSAGQPYIEPSIANKYGTTHLGLRFGFLF